MLLGVSLLQLPVQLIFRRGCVWVAGGILLFVAWAAMTWIASKVDGIGDVAAKRSIVTQKENPFYTPAGIGLVKRNIHQTNSVTSC